MANVLSVADLDQVHLALYRASLLRGTLARIVGAHIPLLVSGVPYVFTDGDKISDGFAAEAVPRFDNGSPRVLRAPTPDGASLEDIIREVIHEENQLWFSLVTRAFALQKDPKYPPYNKLVLSEGMHVVSTTDSEAFAQEQGLLRDPSLGRQWREPYLGRHPKTHGVVYNFLTAKGEPVLEEGRVITCADPRGLGIYSEAGQSRYLQDANHSHMRYSLHAVVGNAHAVWEGFTLTPKEANNG